MRAFAITLLLTAVACGRGGFSGGIVSPPDDPGQPDVLPVLPLYPQHARWNAYVARVSGTPSWKQADVTCASADSLGECVHSGEARYVVLPNAADCVGHEAHDALGAFDWRCDDDDGVRFVTTALRADVVLADLLEGTAGFKANNVIVDGISGTPRPWWDNPVSPLPSTASLSVADTVYVATGALTQGYQVDADGVSVVVPRGKALSFAVGPVATCIPELKLGADKRCLVHAVAHERLWLEGDFDVAGNFELAIGLSGSSLVHVRHALMQRGGYGLVLIGTRAVDMSRSTSASHIRYGVVLQSAVGTRLFHDAIHQVQPTEGSAGVLIQSDNRDTTIVDVVIDGGAQFGIQEADPTLPNTRTNLAFLTVVNNLYIGISLNKLATATVTQVASMNNGTYGVALANSSDVTLGMVALAYNDTGPVAGAPGGQLPKSNVIIDLAGGTHPVDAADAGFIGAGFDARDASAITDWSRAAYHSYGPKADAFPAAVSRTACSTGPCSDWDWRLTSSPDGLAFRSLTGNAGSNPFVAGATCPALPLLNDGRGNQFVVNAIEIYGDGFGDDDGLCEATESCIYAPNVGAYQGEGELIGPCVGAPLGVTLLAYARAAISVTR